MIRSAADPKRLSPSLIWSPYQRRMPFSGAPCMLNFFFPFLNTAAQPNPEPEAAAVQKTRQRVEPATPEHSDHLPSPDPVPQPQAPHRKSAGSSAKRATKPVGQVRAKKVVAGRG